MSEKKWIQTWGQSHSALSLFLYPSEPKTYRLVMNTAISGEKLRLSISNTDGKNDVVIWGITAAKCDADGNVSDDDFFPGHPRPVNAPVVLFDIGAQQVHVHVGVDHIGIDSI